MKVTYLVFIIVTVVAQTYSTAPQHQVYVILGNSALVKCEIPSFVADFISVINWVDNNGAEYFPNHIGINAKTYHNWGHMNCEETATST